MRLLPGSPRDALEDYGSGASDGGHRFPRSLSMEGWRVIEVETEITGKGTPIKKSDTSITVPTIAWHEVPNRYLCRKCSEKLADAGRGSEAADYFVFDME